jgi:hypothetical protein
MAVAPRGAQASLLQVGGFIVAQIGESWGAARVLDMHQHDSDSVGKIP